MIEINRTMTAQSPAFGVPAYGQTSFEGTAISAFGAQVSTCARVRHIGGDMALATAKGFPGTSAWRPPTC